MTVQEFCTDLLLACVAVITVAIICIEIFKQKSQPPCLGYWIPWIGCAVEFGKEPLYFIERARRKVGLRVEYIYNFFCNNF